MAKTPGATPTVARTPNRPARTTPAPKPPAAVKAAPSPAPRKRTSPVQFFREVRVEARKITWTPWKETWITSVMVFIMVVATALFFWLVDIVLSFLLQQVLKLAG
jgi:preprotein translocase subunit SecE